MGLTLDQTSVEGRMAVQLLMFVHHLLCIQTERKKSPVLLFNWHNFMITLRTGHGRLTRCEYVTLDSG